MVMTHFREGNYGDASPEVKQAWLLFIGKFLTATEKGWEKVVLNMDMEAVKQYGEKPTGGNKMLVTVPTEALCHYNLEEYVPRWKAEWAKPPQEGVSNGGTHSVSGLSTDLGGKQCKPTNPV